MAYAAITSLMNTIQQSMQLTRCNLRSFYEKLESLRSIMEKLCNITEDIEALTSLEAEIKEVAFSAEDKVDSRSIKVLCLKTPTLRNNAFWKLCCCLEQAVERIDSIMKQWMAIRDWYTNIKGLKAQKFSLASIPERVVEPENIMVGHEIEFEMMQDQLARGSSELEAVSIIGMGGIGKTTLANKLYTDSFIMSRFDIRAKVTVSQEYCVRNVLLGLLSSISGRTNEYFEQDDGQLADQLQKLLKGRRYLIVIDDIWTTEAWDDIKLCFPDYTNGSRILLTTRNVEVAEYASSGNPPCQMRLLDFNESWDLLHRKVFEKDCFSPEFEKIGKEIALKCGGLPLAIAVIAGLLSKIGKVLDEWQSVAEKVRSMVSTDVDVQCMRVLALSYHHLPHHLKACFLYFGIFPEDAEIYADKLLELWAADGFLKVEEMKSIEEVAEKCLKDLIDRSLISIHYVTGDGRVKFCRIHDVIRELCLKEARNMNIVNFIGEKNDQNPSAQSMHFSSNSRGRTSTQLNYRIIVKKLARCPNNEARSIFFFNSKSGFMSELLPFKLVRVLDLSLMNFIVFPSGILDLIHLRYLALRLSPTVHYYLGKETLSSIDIPPSISRLCYLETFILGQPHYEAPRHPLILPSEILTMPQLRHLRLGWNYLHYHELTENSLVLKNLRHLSGWNPWYCTGSFFRLFPNLKKLEIWGVEEDFRSRKDLYDFRCLDQLEELEFHMSHLNYHACFLESITPSGATPQDPLRFLKMPGPTPTHTIPPTPDAVPPLLLPPPDAFPQNLKTLSLYMTCLWWKDLSIVGKLPKLEVLKLIADPCKGKEWEVVEDGFPCLKFLYLEEVDFKYWRASCHHFPCLERLVIVHCWCLDSIPQDFADITTLVRISVTGCAESVGISAEQIQQDMLDNYGSSSLVVHIGSVFKPKEEEEEEEEEETY
ncbi:putative late blight resistance protein homolog R1B-16 isoform X1 [Nicotiana tabacum]|uniref:Late blight resistance protein homolog R1B-16 isoform X1 n=1 Tax=Nicotiana tabacum TaxID=4097 RepID=A0A1S4BPT1_TOBAC|nr:PREDICTED: putative late blight resistance protein homolog R1B-16 isoform X1 [Nicotiana tabacum]XP_016490889.1 PREDICTED: putative late blight resistance protein homolog R1B-16 isoform X1 [Nicotiana tabacum]